MKYKLPSLVCLAFCLFMFSCEEEPQPFMASAAVDINQKIGSNSSINVPLDHTNLIFEMPDFNKLTSGYLHELSESKMCVTGKSVSFLCDTSMRFCKSMKMEELVGSSEFWHDRMGVLSSLNRDGPFKGNGERYIGIRVDDKGRYKYGWVLMNFTPDMDTMHIISMAINDEYNSAICTGIDNGDLD
ncbi:MAG: hypothetical protein MRY83_10625 [Flavobacteriales bacterium]|nr:hypothetical protein [Flavobacteriales bacterium]